MDEIYEYLDKNQNLNWAILEPKIADALSGDKNLLLIREISGSSIRYSDIEGPLNNFTYDDVLKEIQSNGVAILTVLGIDASTKEMKEIRQIVVNKDTTFDFGSYSYEFYEREDGSYEILMMGE